MAQTLQAQPGMTTTREAMILTFESHKQYLAPHIFQRGKEFLRLLYTTAQVVLTVHDQQRRMHLLHIANRRHAQVKLRIIPGGRFQVIVGKIPADVAGAKEGVSIDYTAIGYRCPEAVGVPNQPVGHKAAIATPCDPQALLVEVALL